MLGKSASVAGSKRFQTFTPGATHRLIACDALPKEKTFDPVDVARPLVHQDLPLTTYAPAILFVGTGRSDHRTDARFTSFVREKGANQGFAVDLVSLRAPASTRRRDRCRIDDIALYAFALQDPMDPEAIKPGLLYDDETKILPGPRPRLLTQS